MRRNSPKASTNWTHLALAAALAVAALMVGCDNSSGKADRKILEGVSQTTPAATPEEGMKNIAALEALTKESDASTGRKALAKAALAGAELETAQQYMKDVQSQELVIGRKIWEMEQVTGQIHASKGMIDSAARRDPSVALPQAVNGETVITDDLKNKASAARQGEVWVKSDNAPLATVSAVKQTISTLTGKISDIKSNIDTLTKQRDQASTAAGKAQQDSLAAKGDESQTAYMKAVDLRKQAALLNVQIEAANASLVPLNQDLATAQAHEKIVTDAAASFDTAGATYTDNYAKIKAQSDKMLATAKDMLGGDSEFSLKSKATQLNALLTTADESRAKAIEQFKAAISHYGDAVSDAEKVKTENKREVPPGSPDELLMKNTNNSYEASSLRLRQAEAQAGLGTTEASYALLLSRKTTALAAATAAASAMNLTAPAELSDAKLADLLKETRTAANEAFTSADSALENVSTGGGGPKAQASAKIARAAVNVAWSQLAADSGDTENAKTRMTAAQGYQKEVSDDTSSTVAVPAYLMILTGTTPAAPVKDTPAATPAVEKPAAPTAPKTDTPATDPSILMPNQ